MTPRVPALLRARRSVGPCVAALLVLGSSACADPALPESTDDAGAVQPPEAEIVDPARDALVAQLTRLHASVAAVRDELARTAAADRTGQPSDRAVALLIGATDPADVEGADAPLFPSATTERGSIDASDDALTATLTAARDAGGELGRATLGLLRDPLAGDLGTWQRDPAGVVASVRSTAAASGDLGALEQAVFELPGEGTRALAWAILAAEARDVEDAAAYAERGVAHLDVILAAIDDLLSSTGTTEDDASDDAAAAGQA